MMLVFAFADPCEKKACKHYAQCVSYDNGRTECECEDQCAKVEEPVCGTDDRDYTNECVLKATACRESRDLAVADNRPCGGKTSVLLYIETSVCIERPAGIRRVKGSIPVRYS